MKSQTITRYIVGICTAVALFSFVYLLNTSVWGAHSLTNSEIAVPNLTSVPAEPRGFALPERLKIPAISVDAAVQHVGLTADKLMGIPTNFKDVGWYKHGTVPGEVGSAVIDGHVDNGLGLKGVFKNLKSLKRGDRVQVLDKEGNEINFIVREVREYPYKEAPSEEIFHEKERTLLRLITCGGKWIKSARTYETRVVVTAEYVPTGS